MQFFVGRNFECRKSLMSQQTMSSYILFETKMEKDMKKKKNTKKQVQIDKQKKQQFIIY